MYSDFNKEPPTEPPEAKAVPRCCLCDEFEDLTEVDGKRYCEKHLLERFDSAGLRHEFILKHPLLWYEFFADAVDEHLDPRVTNALLVALERYDNANDVETFCGTYAEDEYRTFVKGEVA